MPARATLEDLGEDPGDRVALGLRPVAPGGLPSCRLSERLGVRSLGRESRQGALPRGVTRCEDSPLAVPGRDAKRRDRARDGRNVDQR